MPDLSEEFIRELIAGKKKEDDKEEAEWKKSILAEITSLKEQFVSRNPTPEDPPTPPLPPDTKPAPENEKKDTQLLTFHRKGRKLILAKEKEKSTSQHENKNQDSGSEKTA